jgi:hypothetical protein
VAMVPFGFFPYTEHVETLALFAPLPADGRV